MAGVSEGFSSSALGAVGTIGAAVALGAPGAGVAVSVGDTAGAEGGGVVAGAVAGAGATAGVTAAGAGFFAALSGRTRSPVWPQAATRSTAGSRRRRMAWLGVVCERTGIR